MMLTNSSDLNSTIDGEDISEDLLLLQIYNETRAFERLVGIIIPSIFTVVIVVGLVGNLLVIIVALNRQMRNSTNTIDMFGLDVFNAVCTIYGYRLCISCLGISDLDLQYDKLFTAYFSVWTLTLMAADRFLAVCYPVKSMTLRSPSNTLIALLVTYGIILISQIQVGRIHDVYYYKFAVENRSACSIVSIAKGEATVFEARLYFFSFNIFGYVIPLSITCILYYFMLKRLWYMPKSGIGTNAGTASISSSNSSLRCRPETIRAKKKVTRLVLFVVVIWALCWLPLNICLLYPEALVLIWGKPIVIAQIFSQVLAYTNSCLNPILYPLVSENFRKGFLRIIGLCMNRVSCGRLCQDYQNFRFNSRAEVTFYNNGSKSRSSTNHRMSRTNSSSQRKSMTTTTNNTITIVGHYSMEGCSLLLRSSFSGANSSHSPGPHNNSTAISTNVLLQTPRMGLAPRRCSSTPSASDLASIVLATSKWQLASNITKHRTSVRLQENEDANDENV